MKIGLITIGNEILTGKTVNTNLSWIGTELIRLGQRIHRSMTVMDRADDIHEALDRFVRDCDLVLTTGGLGPTKDDITKRVIADFFGRKMVFSEEVWQQVQERFSKRGIEMPLINRNQAELPEGFVALKNPYGTAPGLLYEHDGKIFVAMPGVPHEMKALMTDHVLPMLKQRIPDAEFFIETIHTSGIAESRIAELTDDLILPEGTELAYLPQTGRVSLRMMSQSRDDVDWVKSRLQETLGDYIWGYGDRKPSDEAHELLLMKGKRVAFAESCTGGLIQKILTDRPGSSKYLVGGVVAYSNEVKQAVLGVSRETLDIHGAVSEETAIEMARGARKLFNVDIAGAVTGIAGPDGGTDEKPVGLVYIAVDNGERVFVEKHRILGVREIVRQISADRLLLLMIKHTGD